MTQKDGEITPEIALGAAFASILMNSIALNSLVAQGLIPPDNLAELMDEALLQVEQLRGLNSTTSVVADIARAHLLNLFENLETLPSFVDEPLRKLGDTTVVR